MQKEKKSKLNFGDYIHIEAPMITELHLKGNELFIYAIIHGFTKNGDNKFTGSISYLSDWTSLSRKTIIEILKSLTDRGLLEKFEREENNVKFCSYRAIYLFNFVNVTGSYESTRVVTKCNGGGVKTTHNTIDNNITIIKKNNKKETDLSFVSDELKEPFELWLKYKKEEKKQTYKTELSLKACYKNLEKLSGGNKSEAMAIVENAMANNWSGIFPIKAQTSASSRVATFQATQHQKNTTYEDF